MEKTSLVIFKKDCMGCHACEIACKQEHGLGVGPRLIRVSEKSPRFIPTYCHHCTKAPCLESCPVEAIFRDARGIVLIDPGRCIGCKECVEACPFGAMQFDDAQETAVKCDLCAERLTHNQAPACSSVCPTGCIFWGSTRKLAERVVAGP
ncbi:MAG: 4Fe-4S binding protein [Desulfobacterales bacterium]|nr:MAG: 4Fe-4S binding protein [Desulfobacterales bacterium]